jgi:hypothetical protein
MNKNDINRYLTSDGQYPSSIPLVSKFLKKLEEFPDFKSNQVFAVGANGDVEVFEAQSSQVKQSAFGMYLRQEIYL